MDFPTSRGVCLYSYPAGSKKIKQICNGFGTTTNSSGCVTDHDPPNTWCRDNVKSMNSTITKDGSALLSLTMIRDSSCNMTLAFELVIGGIHNFSIMQCTYQMECTLGK